jgi:HAD superfamily phosphoserine phosphatase-like hydrolase
MIAAFDLDGTLLRQNGSLAFCDFLCEKGYLSRRDMIYYAMTYARHRFFGLSFWDLHQLIFKRSFQGCSAEALLPFVKEFLAKRLDLLWYIPAVLRLKRLRSRGFECMIFSNSPRFFVEHVARQLGVEKVYATEYLLDETGCFTQLTLLMDGEQKKTEILALGNKKTVAFSDSHHDLPFLEAAHTAVAVNPHRLLKREAFKRGWEIL